MIDLDFYVTNILEQCVYDPQTGCMLWLQSTQKGYGRINIRALHPQYKVKMVQTHRIVAARKYGFDLLDATIKVRHTCDRPACNEEDHLVLGTQLDNVHDAMERGRYSPPPPAMRQLTDEQVMQIRAERDGGASLRYIAKDWQMAKTSIVKIVNRVSYADVP